MKGQNVALKAAMNSERVERTRLPSLATGPTAVVFGKNAGRV